MSIAVASHFLSPLTGLGAFPRPVPRLTPWATFWRRSAPSIAVASYPHYKTSNLNDVKELKG